MTEEKATQHDPLADLFEPRFAVEEYSLALVDELLPLFFVHYREIATYQDIALKPRWEKYKALHERKLLRIHTSRLDGQAIGYAVWILDTHLHYEDLYQAQNDILYIEKARRGFGKRFIEWSLAQLKAEKVRDAILHVKLAHDWSPMAERMGFTKTEVILQKRLD